MSPMSRSEWAASLTVPVSPERDHIRGALVAPVTVLEYGDYECPFCAAAYPVVEQLRARAGSRIRFAYRHFPLTTLHPNAQAAAEAAEAAATRGKFWEMHDLIYSHPGRVEPADLMTYARALGIDEEELLAELTGRVHAPRVRQDFMSGVRSGVNGTPTFFINGVRHDGLVDLPSLLAAVQHAQSGSAHAP